MSTAAAAVTIAGLPQKLVLKSTFNGNRMQYLWNEGEFEEYYKCMGTNLATAPDWVSPFARLEVVPSTTDPANFIHLRCAYNNKVIQLVWIKGLVALSATADEPDEDRDKDSCTLFQPVFENNTVKLIALRNYNGGPVYTSQNPSLPLKFNGLSVVYAKAKATYFEFDTWVSCEDRLASKDEEIGKLEGQVAAMEAAEKERDATLAAEESKVEALMAAVWEAFKANTA